MIVSYTFPPAPGIGGRRWTKFSKYFSKYGIDFRVIAAKNQLKSNSVWIKDISANQENITYLDSNYPKVLSTYPNSLFDKIKYRYDVQKAKLLTQGNFYDKSIYWIKLLETEVVMNYQKGYKNLIISGAPFHQMEITRLKKMLPELKVFLDFRDPWVSNRTAYGFEEMSLERQAYETNLEKTVISDADAVVSVAKQMADYFSAVGAKRSICIPNGFDSEDYDNLNPTMINQDSLKCIFAGSLYNQLTPILKEFIKAAEFLEENYPNKIRFEFIGTLPAWFKSDTKNVENISVSNGVSKERALKEINDSDFGMLFLTEDINYSVSSKMLDYIAMNKPILCFSKSDSITGKMIEEKGLGHSINIHSVQKKLIEVIKNSYKINELEFGKLQQYYNLDNLAKSWLDLIEDVNSD